LRVRDGAGAGAERCAAGRRSARAEDVVAGPRARRVVAEPAGGRRHVRVGRAVQRGSGAGDGVRCGGRHERRSGRREREDRAHRGADRARGERAEVIGRPGGERRGRQREVDGGVAGAERGAAGRGEARPEGVVAGPGVRGGVAEPADRVTAVGVDCRVERRRVVRDGGRRDRRHARRRRRRREGEDGAQRGADGARSERAEVIRRRGHEARERLRERDVGDARAERLVGRRGAEHLVARARVGRAVAEPARRGEPVRVHRAVERRRGRRHRRGRQRVHRRRRRRVEGEDRTERRAHRVGVDRAVVVGRPRRQAGDALREGHGARPRAERRAAGRRGARPERVVASARAGSRVAEPACRRGAVRVAGPVQRGRARGDRRRRQRVHRRQRRLRREREHRAERRPVVVEDDRAVVIRRPRGEAREAEGVRDARGAGAEVRVRTGGDRRARAERVVADAGVRRAVAVVAVRAVAVRISRPVEGGRARRDERRGRGRRRRRGRRGERQHSAERDPLEARGDRAVVVRGPGRQARHLLRVSDGRVSRSQVRPAGRRRARAEHVVAGARVGEAVAEVPRRQGAAGIGRAVEERRRVGEARHSRRGDGGRQGCREREDRAKRGAHRVLRDGAEVVGRARGEPRDPLEESRVARARAERRAPDERRARAERVVAGPRAGRGIAEPARRRGAARVRGPVELRRRAREQRRRARRHRRCVRQRRERQDRAERRPVRVVGDRAEVIRRRRDEAADSERVVDRRRAEPEVGVAAGGGWHAHAERVVAGARARRAVAVVAVRGVPVGVRRAVERRRARRDERRRRRHRRRQVRRRERQDRSERRPLEALGDRAEVVRRARRQPRDLLREVHVRVAGAQVRPARRRGARAERVVAGAGVGEAVAEVACRRRAVGDRHAVQVGRADREARRGRRGGHRRQGRREREDRAHRGPGRVGGDRAVVIGRPGGEPGDALQEGDVARSGAEGRAAGSRSAGAERVVARARAGRGVAEPARRRGAARVRAPVQLSGGPRQQRRCARVHDRRVRQRREREHRAERGPVVVPADRAEVVRRRGDEAGDAARERDARGARAERRVAAGGRRRSRAEEIIAETRARRRVAEVTESGVPVGVRCPVERHRCRRDERRGRGRRHRCRRRRERQDRAERRAFEALSDRAEVVRRPGGEARDLLRVGHRRDAGPDVRAAGHGGARSEDVVAGAGVGEGVAEPARRRGAVGVGRPVQEGRGAREARRGRRRDGGRRGRREADDGAERRPHSVLSDRAVVVRRRGREPGDPLREGRVAGAGPEGGPAGAGARVPNTSLQEPGAVVA
jgi:hypothetical protein